MDAFVKAVNSGNARAKSRISAELLESPHLLLGIDSRASKAAASRAWKKLQLVYHPDRANNHSPEISALINVRALAMRHAMLCVLRH